MKNFIFKSSEEDSGLIKNLFNKLDMLLAEQRHQRSDLYTLKTICTRLLNSANLQKQVDNYFEENKEDILNDDKEPD